MFKGRKVCRYYCRQRYHEKEGVTELFSLQTHELCVFFFFCRVDSYLCLYFIEAVENRSLPSWKWVGDTWQHSRG